MIEVICNIVTSCRWRGPDEQGRGKCKRSGILHVYGGPYLGQSPVDPLLACYNTPKLTPEIKGRMIIGAFLTVNFDCLELQFVE